MREMMGKSGPWLLGLAALLILGSGIYLTASECENPTGGGVAYDTSSKVSQVGAKELSDPVQVAAYTQLKKGKAVPDFDIPALGSGRIKLSDYRGKVVVIDFWSVTCPPCIEAGRHLETMYHKYGKKGFVPLGINLDPYPNMAKKFVDRTKLTYPIGFATDKLVMDYGGIRTIPQSFLVDQKGNLYRHFDGWGQPFAVQMEKDIKDLLKIK